jgi:S1-C subfamily serine protease
MDVAQIVNTAVQVIGIDTAASQSPSFASSATEGFAIPIDEALAVALQIDSGRQSTTAHLGSTAFLGVGLSPSAAQSSPANLFGNASPSSGAPSPSGPTVNSVLSGGPAAQAGLAPGDVITSLAGQSLDANTRISTPLVGHHPGDKVQIKWIDPAGLTHTATVTLSGPPAWPSRRSRGPGMLGSSGPGTSLGGFGSWRVREQSGIPHPLRSSGPRSGHCPAAWIPHVG